jgi:autotransporter strand-loop-strand O-heptosyltransferase
MEKRMRLLFESEYPNIKWEDENTWMHTPYYAVYHMGIYTPDNECNRQPEDFRLNGLHDAAGLILGFEDTHEEHPPRVASVEPTMPVPPDPYVCIATAASARCKEWLNPNGWPVVVDWLKTNGYSVVDIDRDFVHGGQGTLNGAIDDTGDIDLRERAAVLKGAKAFIGVSSGLAWLAWACGTPVVLISGWTLPRTEFHTPYRVINRLVCHGCWNDGRENYDHFDSNYCPRHKDTPREHECSKGISSYQVLVQLSRVLGVEL